MSERTQKINVYAIRRAILTALYEYANPQSFGTVLLNHALLLAVAGGRLRLTNEDIQDIRTEWNYLLSKGYLVAIEGYDDYAKLSADVRSKLDAWDKLTAPNPLSGDERLYGPEALR